MKANSRQKGFTLVEILIVVVILGILAAIVIPQFSEASSEARASSVQSNLQMLRSQIELYKVQHNGALPGAGTASFTAALTGKTDVNGATSATGAYGPYMVSIPTNAYSDASTVTITATSGAPTVSTSAGWEWNSADAKIYCPYDATTVTW